MWVDGTGTLTWCMRPRVWLCCPERPTCRVRRNHGVWHTIRCENPHLAWACPNHGLPAWQGGHSLTRGAASFPQGPRHPVAGGGAGGVLRHVAARWPAQDAAEFADMCHAAHVRAGAPTHRMRQASSPRELGTAVRRAPGREGRGASAMHAGTAPHAVTPSWRASNPVAPDHAFPVGRVRCSTVVLSAASFHGGDCRRRPWVQRPPHAR